MKYTFEISLAGCSTKCMHCYISGGPSKNMDYAQYIKCLNKIKPVLDRIDGEISVTPGNEPLNHPQAEKIISQTHSLIPKYYPGRDFEVPTTGLGFLNKANKDGIVNTLRDIGSSDIMLTLHGNESHHNEIVKNSLGYDCIARTADFFNAKGFNINYNLILSKYLIQDWDDVMNFIKKHHKSHVYLSIPLYIPTERLNEFQRYRAEYDDCLKLKGCLSQIGIDEDAFFIKVKANCETSILNRIKSNFEYNKAEESLPNWAFFNIDEDMNLYYGNAGARTQLLGNIFELSEEELYSKILFFKSNYGYSAYYDVEKLPKDQEVVDHIVPLKTNYVYPDISDGLYYWFNQMKIPTILLENQ